VPLVFAAFVAGNIAVQQLSELPSKLHFLLCLGAAQWRFAPMGP